MQSIPLIKRLLLYLLLFFITIISVIIYTTIGREFYEMYFWFFFAVFVFLIPHYIFGMIFLKTKWIFKLIVPLLTAIVSFGTMWLIPTESVWGMIGSSVIFSTIWVGIVIYFLVAIVWEITYQILIREAKNARSKKRQ